MFFANYMSFLVLIVMIREGFCVVPCEFQREKQAVYQNPFFFFLLAFLCLFIHVTLFSFTLLGNVFIVKERMKRTSRQKETMLVGLGSWQGKNKKEKKF